MIADEMIPQIDLMAQYLSIKTEIDDALIQVAEDGHYILGQNVKELEAKISAYCGCRYGVGVASGTDALLLSLVALGVGPGDEIITTPFSFIATADSIALTGATPVFADIDARTFNLSPERVEAAVTAKTKAILPVHLYGQPADMSAIMEIAGRHDLHVVEDAAQAIGAEWRSKRVGSFGDAAAFSFFPTKNLGGFGDGGMIVTDNSNSRLLPYLTANVQFELDRRSKVLMVPNAALRWRPSAEQVAPEAREAFERLAGRKGKPEGGSASPSKTGTGSASSTSRTALWVPEGDYVKPVRVQAGMTDGSFTELQGEGLTEGMRIVTGVQSQTNNEDVATNPFTPKFPPRGGTARPK